MSRTRDGLALVINIGVVLAGVEVGKHGVAVVVAFDGDECVLIFTRERGDFGREFLGREVRVKLGTLHAGGALDDLGAGVVALNAAAGRVDTDDVFGGGLRRKKNRDTAVVAGSCRE